MADKRTVFVVNLFFAHYREPIMECLLGSDSYTYVLCADTDDVTRSGIKAWYPSDSTQFIKIPGKKILNKFYIQHGVIRLALNKEPIAIIYPGDAQHLSTWVSAVLARISGKRVLFWTHGWHRHESGIKALVRCSFYRLANGLLLYGHHAKTIGLEHEFRAENLYVIYNSLDYEFQKKLRDEVSESDIITTRQQLFDNPFLPVIICTGRLIKRRRIELLLSAVDLLRRQGHDLNVLIVGSGPDSESLKRLAVELGVSTKFVGEEYDERTLSRFFMASNATVCPEFAGLTIIHSLTYGTPVITHDGIEDQGPEIEAIIPGVNGQLYRRNDLYHLAQVIKNWTQTCLPLSEQRRQCQQVIEEKYNPKMQRRIIEIAISGGPAL